MNIQRSRTGSLNSFRDLASRFNTTVKTARYSEIEGIHSDCMLKVHGKFVMSLENLIYYPEKIRYFELK
jgi:hypothetical protein